MSNNRRTSTTLTLNVDDMDAGFVEALKRDYAHADVEIRVQDVPQSATAFNEEDFSNLISLRSRAW